MACNCRAFAARYWARIARRLTNGPDQAARDIADHRLRLEEVIDEEGFEAHAAVEHQLGVEVHPGDLHVEPGRRQVALGLADIGPVLEQLRGHPDAQPVEVQVEESRGHARHGLRVAIGEEVDPVLGHDDVLVHDQLLALVPAHLGLEPQDTQLGAAGRFLVGLGDLEAPLLELDGEVQVLEPLVQSHQPEIILGDVGDQAGHEGVPPLDGDVDALPRRVPGVPQLPVDVQLPGEIQARLVIPVREGEEIPREIRVVEDAGPIDREPAGPIHPRAGPDAEEGQIGPRPRKDLVHRELDVLIQDPQLPIVGHGPIDQGGQGLILVELLDPELGRVLRAGLPIEARRQALALRLRLAEVRDSAGREGQQHEAAGDRARNRVRAMPGVRESR